MYKYSGISKPFSRPPTHGGINWLEIPATDLDAATKFYQSIFPSWNFANPSKYPSEFVRLFKAEKPDYIEGAFIKVNERSLTTCNNFKTEGVGFVPYFLADSIDEIHHKILDLGGQLCLQKTDGRGDGWFAKYFDPDGNVFGLWQVRIE